MAGVPEFMEMTGADASVAHQYLEVSVSALCRKLHLPPRAGARVRARVFDPAQQ